MHDQAKIHVNCKVYSVLQMKEDTMYIKCIVFCRRDWRCKGKVSDPFSCHNERPPLLRCTKYECK